MPIERGSAVYSSNTSLLCPLALCHHLVRTTTLKRVRCVSIVVLCIVNCIAICVSWKLLFQLLVPADWNESLMVSKDVHFIILYKRLLLSKVHSLGRGTHYSPCNSCKGLRLQQEKHRMQSVGNVHFSRNKLAGPNGQSNKVVYNQQGFHQLVEVQYSLQSLLGRT